ncbi:MAG TPA: site-2 protease family protein [Chlamydiales bacterium]|nr:site-2 protease family protein [Chlamydiales bacterium]
MIEIPGRIPIAIHPFFWVLAAFIGWINSAGSFLWMFIWIGIIFFSVLIHEYGHALTSVFFKQKARIQLVAMGGVTSFDGPKLKFWQQFLIVFNGPLFGFLLYVIATLLLQFHWSPLPTAILKMTALANVFWTVVNLLPVVPLDGGQLLRIVLEANFGIKGFKASLLIGAILSAVFAFAFFMVQMFLAGALFFLFAFQSFDLWRQSRYATGFDRDEETKKILQSGEMALREGQADVAKEAFAKVLEKTKRGVLAAAARQYLALIKVKEGERKEAYELMLPEQDHLSDETKCVMQKLAEEFMNDKLVAKLSSSCYQIQSTKEVALRNARAFARLKEPKLAGGWLQTAWKHGDVNLEKILQEEIFVALKTSRQFNEFVDQMRS